MVSSNTSPSIELPELAPSGSRSTRDASQDAPELESTSAVLIGSEPPPDRGKGAWCFLAAAFFVELLVFGFPNSYGVLLDAYRQEPTFQHESETLSLIGQLTLGLTYMLSPFVFAFLQLLPNLKRACIIAGSILCPASLLASAFATSTGSLLAFQGVTYAIGAALIYYSSQFYLQSWFVARRGMANATAVGGAVFPLLYSTLIHRYGIKATLIGIAIAYACLFSLIVPFLRPRTKTSPGRGFGFGPSTRASLKQRIIWLFFVANTFQSMGFFLPSIWLPTFATALGLSPTQSSSTVTTLNSAAVVSRIGLGVLSDHQSPHLLASVTCVGASLSVYLAWGVGGTSFSSLLVFSLLYGAFAAGFTSLWSGVIREVAKTDAEASATLFGLLSFSRGVGPLLSAPIATALQRSSWKGHALGLGVQGGLFAGIILFAGSSLAAAGLLESTQAVRQTRKRIE